MSRRRLVPAFAVLWMALAGSFTVANLALGLALAALALFLVRRELPALPAIRRRPSAVLRLALFFLRELFLSAARMVRILLSRRLDIRPALFAFPLRLDRDGEIALLANMITLTPGTLSVDVSADRSILFVHAIDCRAPDAARADIREGFERLILETRR